jgi:hypothetical protein
MRNWLIFGKERFPLPVYLILCGGFTFSGLFLFHSSFRWISFGFSYCGLLLFFFELRLMDEVKDFKKDAVAHPERPLPRGLISLAQARQITMYILIVMVLFALLAGMLLNTQSAISYLAVTVYLGLMYKEFFIGKWLEGKPVFYAILHQSIIFAVCVFTITVIELGKYFHPQTFYLCFTLTGAFWGYEICRKLDPQANKILKTYLFVHGPVKTSLLVIVATGLAAVGGAGLNLTILLWPAEGLLIISLIFIQVNPRLFRLVESIATLSLIVHLWGVAVNHILASRI